MKLTITLVICSLIGYHLWNNEKTRELNLENKQNITNAVMASARSSLTPATRNISEHANIAKTLRLVAEKWKIADTNKDKQYNCIDAAVLFYQYYPDRSNVCIMVNRNPKTGMHHLFNCVFTNGVWKAIEPQSFANNYSCYYMWSVWGGKYNSAYNRDVTSDYLRYVGSL